MITKKAVLANAAALVLASYPHQILADTFTAADVLEWSEESQDNYFQISVTMIGIVATQTGDHNHIAECIDSWYGGGDASQPQRSMRIREVMQALTDYHPQAVILAVVEDACGDF